MKFDRMPENARERGTMIPLYVLFMMILLGMLTVIMGATQVYIKQRGLTSLADGGVLAAANGINSDALYAEGLDTDGRVELAESQAETALREYMQNTTPDGAECGVTNVDGSRVSVACEKTVELPISDWTVPIQTEVSAEAAVVN